MLDHLSITVSDIPAAKRLYAVILKALEIGQPGLRDPDGNRFEAVCRLAP
jgi:hypothetical protein